MEKMISFYNKEVYRYKQTCETLIPAHFPTVEDFINNDGTSISWSRAVRSDLGKFKEREYNPKYLTQGYYRPFTKQNLYFDRAFINDVALIPSLFPDKHTSNLVMCITGRGSTKEFSVLISNSIPDLELISKGQCFPLFVYESRLNSTSPINNKSIYEKNDGISDVGLKHFQKFYSELNISKEDIFYYAYGLFHSEEYRKRYKDNLAKELPRIPCIKVLNDFWAFSQAGRDLADLHLNYETVDCYPVTLETGGKSIKDFDNQDYYVTKMKYAKNGKEKDLTTVIYNNQITIKNIPVEAYEYVVNGKPALDWVIERQGGSTEKNSQITNDANDWAVETMGNAKYPLELFQRVITVSLETMKIVKSLPKLDI
jgi:predicted helicase